MWTVFGFTTVIGAAWFAKMILQKRILIQRTPLDIPVLLFLISQFISTIFSLDTHTSIWGYYSRFNGGFLSIFSYIFLYYAFLSNLNSLGNLLVKRILIVSLFSGFVIALWGLPSHFGYDPTCLMFRGTFDVSCWTDAFQPKVRIFSTLGQPNWMAAHLAILIPIAIAFAIQKSRNSDKSTTPKFRTSDYLTLQVFRVFWKEILLLLLTVLFFVDVLYTRSNSGFLGLMAGLLLFVTIFLLNSVKSSLYKILVSLSGLIIFSSWILLKWKDIKIISIFSTIFFILFFAYFIYASFKSKDSILYRLRSILLLISGILIIISLFIGTPMTPKLSEIMPKLSAPAKTIEQPKKEIQPQGPALEVGGTDSGKIRLIVWRGAIDIWKAYPVFGSGVETYAYAYYRFRPQSHNMTSEWDYLYNKAHNEYLNYLATTGAFGLGSYFLMIGWFLFLSIKSLISRFDSQHPASNFPLLVALLASYVSILVSNFFGFSVVTVNLYLFFIPALFLVLSNNINPEKISGFPKAIDNQNANSKKQTSQISGFQWFGIVSVSFISLYLIFNLYRFWQADVAYALGNNLDKVGQYQQGYANLHEAVNIRSDEPVFKDELTYNDAVLATAILSQKAENITPESKQTAEKLISEAIQTSNGIISDHPNNIVSWKTRVRMFYTLSRVQPQFLNDALIAISKTAELAPTDAKIYYNFGVLQGQAGDPQKAIEILKRTVELKPDYRDAYYALGLFYREAAIDKNQKVIKPEMQQKAVETMNFILTNINKNDGQAKQALQSWGEK